MSDIKPETYIKLIAQMNEHAATMGELEDAGKRVMHSLVAELQEQLDENRKISYEEFTTTFGGSRIPC